MIKRTLDAGVSAAWVTADAVYVSDSKFRSAIERRGLGYVVGVRSDRSVCVGFRQVRVAKLLAEAPAGAWHRLSCGDGAKGPRLFDWALHPVNSPEPDQYTRWPLVRRDVGDPQPLDYFLCGGPPDTTLENWSPWPRKFGDRCIHIAPVINSIAEGCEPVTIPTEPLIPHKIASILAQTNVRLASHVILPGRSSSCNLPSFEGSAKRLSRPCAMVMRP